MSATAKCRVLLAFTPLWFVLMLGQSILIGLYDGVKAFGECVGEMRVFWYREIYRPARYGSTLDKRRASTTTAEPSPSPERKTICTWPFCECDPNIPLMCGLPAPSSRPVSTDEEEGQGFEDGGLQSRPSGGGS